MSNELNVLTLVMEASLVVQAVMLLLLILSIASWVVIIEKSRALKQAVGGASEVGNRYGSGGDLSAAYREVSAEEWPQGVAGVFESGFREFGRLRQEVGLSPGQIVEGARRSMNVSQLREMDRR